MAGGDVCTQRFNVISSAPVQPVDALDLPNATVTDCCFSLPVLATLAGTIDSENDQSSFLVCREENITNVDLFLDKYVSGVWSEVTALNNNSYGKDYEWEFYVSKNADGTTYKNYRGYKLDWQLVLNAFGSGSYRIRTVETPIAGSDINNYSNEWCLKIY